jgi:DNA modification methylase
MTLDEQIMNRVEKALAKKNLGTSQTKEFSIYWGKKNIDIATKLIEEFLPNGGMVIDPFVGSGSTIYGALQAKQGITVTGIDVNEQPISQIRFNIEECKTDSFEGFDSFLNELESSFLESYTYTLDQEEFIFQKCSLNLDMGKISINEITLQNSSTRYSLLITPEDHLFQEVSARYLEIQTKNVGPKMDLLLETNSRIAVKHGMKLSDMYSPLNFQVLLWLRNRIESDNYLKGLLSSVLHLAKYTDKGSQSQFPFWYPKKDAIDRNLINLMRDKHKQIKKSVYAGANLFESDCNQNKYQLFNIPVQKIEENLAKNSQNLVITDPPYFDQVAYSEYLVPWEFFCHSKVDMESEIVESNRSGANKSRESYLNDMSIAFKSIRQVCTNDALMFFYYKDARLSNIHEILVLLETAGWKFIGQTHVDKKGFSYKQNSTKVNTVEGDCLMVFQASSPSILKLSTPSSKELADKFVALTAAEYVRRTKPSTLSEIYDNVLVKSLYSLGYLSYYKTPQEITSILNKVLNFDELERKFYV